MSPPGADLDDDEGALIERRAACARYARGRSSGLHDPARRDVDDRAGARLKGAAGARRSAPSFGEDPRPLPADVGRRTASCACRVATFANPYRGVDLASTFDRAHAPRGVPEPGRRSSSCATGFGQAPLGSSEVPFSCRERVLNALSSDESLNAGRTGAHASPDEDLVAACGTVPSAQYRSMVNMLSEAAAEGPRARRPMLDSRGRRLFQLVEMLDLAAVID